MYLELHRFCCLQLVTADDVIAQLFLEAVVMVGGPLIASQRRCLRRDDGALVGALLLQCDVQLAEFASERLYP